MKKLGVVVGSIAGIFLLMLAVLVGAHMARQRLRDRSGPIQFSDVPYVPTVATVYPNSTALGHSLVVPTMDTKMVKGKNVIWCASFQLAWNHLGTEVLHEPPAVANAEEIAAQLNGSKFSEDDLSSDCFYATAGRCRDGIVDTIHEEMQRRFRRTPRIDLTNPEYVIVAYGYLDVSVPFAIPYCENPGEFLFTDSKGTKTSVTSFGTVPGGRSVCRKELRDQAKVLYCAYDEPMKPTREMTEFVIDPCRDSLPNQVILACVPPKETLQQTWDYVAQLIAAYPHQQFADERLDYTDCLLVPNMAWDITHHFTALEGRDKLLKNKGSEGLYVAAAIQGICFRLDRSGVELRSEAAVAVCGIPREFVFNRPYTIFIRKRDSAAPFFAMYVDNAELLCKAATPSAVKSGKGNESRE